MIIKTLILHNQGLRCYVKKMFIKQRRHHVNACVIFPERVKLFNEINNGFRSTEYEREIEDNERVLVSDGVYTTEDLIINVPYIIEDVDEVINTNEQHNTITENNLYNTLNSIHEKFR